MEDVKLSLQRSHSLYDRAGDQHYQCISALIKSMRRGDDNAALYWLVRMLEGGEDPLFIARRIVVFASEDVGKLGRLIVMEMANLPVLLCRLSWYRSC